MSFHLPRDNLPSVILRGLQTRLAQSRLERGVTENTVDRRGEALDVVLLDHDAVDVVEAEIAIAVRVGGDHRATRGHRLEHGERVLRHVVKVEERPVDGLGGEGVRGEMNDDVDRVPSHHARQLRRVAEVEAVERCDWW